MKVTRFWWARSRRGSKRFHAVLNGAAPWEQETAVCGAVLCRASYLASRTDLDKIPTDAHGCPACLKKIREM